MVLPSVRPRRLIVLCGPTAVGKTVAAMELARQIGGEIVAADSRTVYRGLDIGTAKPTPEQQALVPHHLLDVATPDTVFTVATYRRLALHAIEQIFARSAIPLLVGGTGLYVRAVVDGLVIPTVAPDWELRSELEEAERQAPGTLHQRLVAIDPIAASRIHPHNVRRLTRAIEVYQRSGVALSAAQQRKAPSFEVAQVGLTMDRQALYARIEQRVDNQITSGLLDEVTRLLAHGYDRTLPSLQAIGYKELIEYLDGKVSLEEAVRRLKRNTRRFAKRQFTWFRKDPRIQWVDVGPQSQRAVVEMLRAMVE